MEFLAAPTFTHMYGDDHTTRINVIQLYIAVPEYSVLCYPGSILGIPRDIENK